MNFELILQRPLACVHCAAPLTIPASKAKIKRKVPNDPVIPAEVAQANHDPAGVSGPYRAD